jgi:hypothetical protein
MQDRGMPDEGAGWSVWMASVPVALVAAAVWTAILAGLAANLSWSRRSYQHGLAAGAGAYLLFTIILYASVSVFPQLPTWPILILIAPLVEEGVRLFFANQVRNERPAWVTFGLGYGLVESGLKVGDSLVFLTRTGEGAANVLIGSVAQLIPLVLHVFLSVVMLALLRAKVSPALTFVVAASLHGIHNWSVSAFFPHDWTSLALSVLIRGAIFLALISLILRISKPPVTAEEAAVG